MYCDCRKDDDTSTEDAQKKFVTDIGMLKRNVQPTFRPIDIYELRISLFKSIIMPELAKGVRFPAPYMIPTYAFQQKTSFSIDTNDKGYSWVEVNMGQFLDSSKFLTGHQTTNPTAGHTFNGNSLRGNSNVFICSNTVLDGVTAISSNGGKYETGATDGICVPKNFMQVSNGNFNAVRSGPMSVKYDYTGRLDNSSGVVTMGLGYTQVIDTTGAYTGTQENGLLADTRYTVSTAIEDLPFARTVPVTDSLKAVFVPQDYTLMTLKAPTDSNSTVVPQRLFILISGGPTSQKGVARITICQNWEGVPSTSTADWVTSSYNSYPCDFDPRGIFDYMIQNNLIITKEDGEFGIERFAAVAQKIAAFKQI